MQETVKKEYGDIMDAFNLLTQHDVTPKVFIVSPTLAERYPEAVEAARRDMEDRCGEPVRLVLYPTIPKGVEFCITTDPWEEETPHVDR